jgi:hypothetical protein
MGCHRGLRKITSGTSYDSHLIGICACMAVSNYLQVKWFSSPLRYTCIRGNSWWWCGVYDIVRCVQVYTTYLVKYNFVITVLCCAGRYCCTVIGRVGGVLLINIAFQFYALSFRPEWCAAVCCTAVVRPQKGVPWNEPFTSSSTCYSTLQPSIFPLTPPPVALVVITFMNLQQFGFLWVCKCS